MKTAYHFAIPVVLSIWFSSGCTIRPGSHLPTSDKEIVGEVEQDISEQVKIYPITFDLIRDISKPIEKPRANPALEVAIDKYEYKVGKGDILNIIIFEHDELTNPSGSYRSAAESGTWVRSDGTIYFPYVGKMLVANKTLEQIRQELSRKLGKYIEEVKVDVNVAQFVSKKVYLTGEIKMPGRVHLTNIPLTLLDAINLAGGLSDRADWQNVILSRGETDEIISLQALLQHGVLTENRLLQPNDIVHVPRNDSLKVFVLGEIRKPSTLLMDRTGMRLTEALSTVGGFNEGSADATGVFVIRRSVDNSTTKANIYQLDLFDASATILGAEFELAPYDVIYVTATPIERWNRVINGLTPILGVYDVLNRNITVNRD